MYAVSLFVWPGVECLTNNDSNKNTSFCLQNLTTATYTVVNLRTRNLPNLTYKIESFGARHRYDIKALKSIITVSNHRISSKNTRMTRILV